MNDAVRQGGKKFVDGIVAPLVFLGAVTLAVPFAV